MDTLAIPATGLRLRNEAIDLEISADGRLLRLENRHTGFNYAGGTHLWRLYLQDGPELDIEITADGLIPKGISETPSRAQLRHASLLREGQPLAISLDISIALIGDEIHWDIRLENHQPGIVVRECHFPLVGGLNLQETPALITSANGGEFIPDLRQKLSGQWKGYITSDHLFSAHSVHYPSPAATNCFVISGREQGLYFGCHQYPVESTHHQFRLYPDSGVEAGIVRFPHLETGRTWGASNHVISPYLGTWHAAARKYRAWADTWFHKPTPPAWVRRLNGWQRIIMEHQYGLRHYLYKDMPQIRQDGDDAGINTLFMFGWHRGGHDNNYPDYEPDPRLGTQEEMLRGIENFNQNGGHVLLYANGRLIDTASDFYQTTGQRISVKDFYGNEVRETYKFQGAGNFTLTAARTFVMACPSSSEWFDLLQGLANKALAWKCHSLFLDQMGYGEYPCCDPSHGHPKLWPGIIQAKANILRQLIAYMRSRDPNLALGIEWASDVTAQYADYVHSITGAGAFLDWFRYTFPEVILSDREIRDGTDARRLLNLAVAKGLRSDVEIYRCRKTVAEIPDYSAHLKEINRLRQAHADLLLEGRYVDTEGFDAALPEGVEARAFRNGERLGIVVTQSRHVEAFATIRVPGHAFEAWDHAGSARVTPASDPQAATIILERDSLVFLAWKRPSSPSQQEKEASL